MWIEIESDLFPDVPIYPGFTYFTHGDGWMTFFSVPQWSGYTAPISAKGISASAVGSTEFYSWGVIPDPGNSLPIQRHSIYSSYKFNDEMIPSAATEPSFKTHSASTMQVQNVIFTALLEPGATHSEITAHRSIHLQVPFHAEAGHELHIYTSIEFPDCDSPQFKMAQAGTDDDLSFDLDKKKTFKSRQMELQFQSPGTGLLIYPNPFESVFRIETSCKDPITISIYDQSGRHIAHAEQVLTGISMDLTGHPPGVYLLELSSDKCHLSKKLIKIH